ncbi:MAG: hypothetical protein IK055_03545 [Lachnospiraceae bacterium]|nr:hypothetical protein [Lachnospiraceae bacterium]
MDGFELEQNRDELRAVLVARLQLLENLVEDFGDRMRGLPQGQIRISHHGQRTMYYYRGQRSERWKYMSVQERSKAEAVINRDYMEQVVAWASGEIRKIRRFLAEGYPSSAREPFSKFSLFRQDLIRPLFPSDEEVIREFYSLTYDPLETFSENKRFETGRGESVRSKAEWMIAQKMAEFDVPYQYEAPLRLKGVGTVRPDFRCFNVRRRKVIYWEHLGRMGDPEYASEALRKMQAYSASGFHIADNLIVTEETVDCPLTPATVEYWIRRMLA